MDQNCDHFSATLDGDESLLLSGTGITNKLNRPSHRVRATDRKVT